MKHIKINSTLIFIILYSITTIAQDIKIEPPFWWAGMKNQNLQLLVYSKNISNSEVAISNSQVQLVKANKVENKNYLFLDIRLTDNIQPGTFDISFKGPDGNSKIVEYELKSRVKKAETYKGFGHEDVLYLIMPDRFSNAKPENDDMPGMLEKADRKNPDGRHGGDLQGIINHLDYIKDLGVTAVWLNPFQENNRKTYSYHGYATTDFYNTDARYGTNADYLNFVNECHKRNLKVCMDVVLNHCDTANWIIMDLPSYDWIHQFPDFTRTNYRIPTQLDPYASNYDKDLMLTGWFDQIMADLNHKNPFLATYLIQNTIWWIEYAGLDGLRLDTQPYADKDYVAKWANAIFYEYPNFNIVGEAWLQKIALTAYWQKDANNADGYNSNIPSVTDFPLYFALVKALNEKDGWVEGMSRLYYVLAQDFLYANPGLNLIFVDNHDLNRFYASIGNNLNKFKMGMAFLLTTRGIPVLFYGTEIAMDGQGKSGHGFIRSDMPGGWPNDKENVFEMKGLTSEQVEAFSFTKKLLNWRKNNSLIHDGKLMQFIPEDGIYVYFRYNQKDAVMVVLNNNEDEKSFETDRYSERLNGFNRGNEIITDTEINNLSLITIPAKSAMIIELKK